MYKPQEKKSLVAAIVSIKK